MKELVRSMMSVGLAAISGGCRDEDAMRVAAQAATVSDAGDPELAKRNAEYEKYRMRRDAVYCDPKLEVVCSFEEPLYDYCDFDAVVAKTCAYSGRIRSLVPTTSDRPFRQHSIGDSDHSITRSDDLISHSDDSITRSDDLIIAAEGGCSVV